MMPNRYRLTLFLAFWIVYAGTLMISGMANKYAAIEYEKTLAKAEQSEDMSAAIDLYADTLTRAAASALDSHEELSGIAYRTTFAIYTSLSIWFYVCACLMDFILARWRRQT